MPLMDCMDGNLKWRNPFIHTDNPAHSASLGLDTATMEERCWTNYYAKANSFILEMSSAEVWQATALPWLTPWVRNEAPSVKSVIKPKRTQELPDQGWLLGVLNITGAAWPDWLNPPSQFSSGCYEKAKGSHQSGGLSHTCILCPFYNSISS